MFILAWHAVGQIDGIFMISEVQYPELSYPAVTFTRTEVMHRYGLLYPNIPSYFTSKVAIVSDLCTSPILPVAIAFLCTPASSSRTHFNGPGGNFLTSAAASEPLLLHLLPSLSLLSLFSVLVGLRPNTSHNPPSRTGNKLSFSRSKSNAPPNHAGISSCSMCCESTGYTSADLSTSSLSTVAGSRSFLMMVQKTEKEVGALQSFSLIS